MKVTFKHPSGSWITYEDGTYSSSSEDLAARLDLNLLSGKKWKLNADGDVVDAAMARAEDDREPDLAHVGWTAVRTLDEEAAGRATRGEAECDFEIDGEPEDMEAMWAEMDDLMETFPG